MKILFLSFSDFKGGANIAAYSIYKCLNNKKKGSFFYTVYSKYKDTKEIFNFFQKTFLNLLRIVEILLIKVFLKKKYHQSLNIFNTKIFNKISCIDADIVNIHWINRSMISLHELSKIKNKVVISLHDMWFLNSTQHYFFKNKDYKDFISKYCLRKKNEIVRKKNFYFIAHNKWMIKKFTEMYPKYKAKIYLCKYYPIDTNIFKPRNKIYLRKKYNIPQNKKIVLFSAQDILDKRKGYEYFIEIVNKLQNQKDIFFLSLGKNNINLKNRNNLKQIDFLPHNSISEYYSLSDIYLCTSLIDNLPLTVLEALASGNVVISFKNGGSTEVLKKVGYTFDIKEKNKIPKFLKNLKPRKIKEISIKSRKYALQNCNKKKIKNQYINIFKKII
tara:strand:+ start:708 stop:1868 length:1161 start_codon:yes stop_codon:yes gene_type:complete